MTHKKDRKSILVEKEEVRFVGDMDISIENSTKDFTKMLKLQDTK
jgi:hypothetical protein